MITTQESQKILEALDMNDLPPQEQEELLLELGDVVLKGVLLRLTELMDIHTQNELTSLIASDPDDEAVIAFLRDRIPDTDRVVEETLADLRSDILAVTGT